VIDQHLSHWATRTYYFQVHSASLLNLQLTVNSVKHGNHYTPCKRLKQTSAKYVSILYEAGAIKLLFFLQQWPTKRSFSLTGCKMCSATANRTKIVHFSILLIITTVLHGMLLAHLVFYIILHPSQYDITSLPVKPPLNVM
jgi:hypothetical protein